MASPPGARAPAFALAAPLRCARVRRPRGARARTPRAARDDAPGLSAETAARAACAARDFATQRAAQQTIFTSRMVRDETRANWLGRFAGGGMEDAHVADALRREGGARVDSDAFLRALLSAPPETILVKKPYAGRGGSTGTNPYIKQKFFEYEVDLLPREVGRRVMDARLQIADELVVDLAMVALEHERLWRCYREAVAAGDDVSIVDALDAPAHTALMDNNLFPGAGSGSASNSPYRVASYDLSLNYTLHLAAGHVVGELLGSSGAQDAREAQWLRGFCAPRTAALLRPPHGIRRASDAFIAALLSEPPRLRGGDVVCDPMRLCERLLESQLAVSKVWISALSRAAQERLDLERDVLEGSL